MDDFEPIIWRDQVVRVKRDPLQIWVAERVRELARRESCQQGRDAADPRCILSPNV
jgi:hypothetical protein